MGLGWVGLGWGQSVRAVISAPFRIKYCVPFKYVAVFGTPDAVVGAADNDGPPSLLSEPASWPPAQPEVLLLIQFQKRKEKKKASSII